MLYRKPFTSIYMDDAVDKPLYFFYDGKLFLSNEMDPTDLPFFYKYYGDKFQEIMYYEYNLPICTVCNIPMNLNGSKPYKPNKQENIRRKQYICPVCNKTHTTNLEKYIKKYSNYTYSVCEKPVKSEFIEYKSYQKKAESIKDGLGVKLNRQTVYYHETKYSDSYITIREESNQKLLKEMGIQASGIYHYDEEFFVDEAKSVRLTILDAVTNQIINDIAIYEKDFDKEFIKLFFKESLEGLPKEVMITDGDTKYPSIIEEMGMEHQLCIFHIIKNQRESSFKKIKKIKKRIKTLKNKIETNNVEIDELKEYGQGKKGPIPNSDKLRKRKHKKRKNLEQENKDLSKQLKEKQDKLEYYEKINERISNIYEADTAQGAQRRFNTIYNQLNEFDTDTQKFLKNLKKKFQKTITYYKNELIPRTNNKIEGYFKITLPTHLKRRYRTQKGALRWIRIQKIRWTERNVLNIKHKNTTQQQYQNQKIKATS